MPNPDKLLEAFLSNKGVFSDYQDSRVTAIINRKFSLNDFTGIQITESELERNARRGDPFSLAMLGKIYYDRGGAFNKSIAFNYFDAAVIKGNHYLANAIANYVIELGYKRKYHRHAIEISRGESKSAVEIQRLKAGDFHRKIVEMTLDQGLKKENHKYRHWWDGEEIVISKWEEKHGGVAQEFINFSQVSPVGFKELCITCSRQQIENALEDKNMAAAYFKQFQRDLADQVLTAQKKSKYKNKSLDSIIGSLSKEYHLDYLEGIKEVIAEREKEIEITSEYILHQMKELVLTKMKELLSEIQMHLHSNEYDEEPEENRDAFTAEESTLLTLICSTSLGSTSLESGQIEGDQTQLIRLIKNNPNIHSNYLQLLAFSEVAENLGITQNPLPPSPVSPQYASNNNDSSSALEQPGLEQPGSEESKYHNTQKLHSVVEVLHAAHSKLEQQNTSQVKPFKWIEFIKIVAAACSVVGIGLMLHSSHVYGTHKFWNSRKQAESKVSKVHKQAATQAKTSIYQVVSDQTKRAAKELPSLKVVSRHKRVGNKD